MADQFLSDRLAKLEAQIVEAETALSAALTEQAQSYSLNTGQTVSTKQNFNLVSLRGTIESLYNSRAVLLARFNGSGVTHASMA